MHRLARKAKFTEFSVGKNRVKLHKYLKNIKKKRPKNGFSALRAVDKCSVRRYDLGVKKQKQAIGKDSRGS